MTSSAVSAEDPEQASSPGPARPAVVKSLHLADGRALCVRTWPGTGDETLVLLHGLLDSSEGWARLCEGIEQTRIAFDLPGFGYSAPTQGSVTGYARDIAEGLELLGVRRFTLVGHSLGGAVATALAELIPDRVSSLVLLAPAGFGRIGLAELVSIPGLRSLVQAALPFALCSRLAVTASYMTVVSRGRMPDHEVVDRVVGRGVALVAGAREGTRAVVEAGRSERGFHRRRVGYHGPVFAVWGDCDHLVPVSHRRGVSKAFPQAEIAVWRGMGHHTLCERFDDLIALLLRATAGHPAPPGMAAAAHADAA